MTQMAIAYIGGAPAEEECAQLGHTPNFGRYNRLEVYTYKAAIIARWGAPPESVKLLAEPCRHDFGTYYEVQAHYDEDDQAAADYVAAIEEGLARWIDVGFLQPVVYGPNGSVRSINYDTRNEAVQRTIVSLERQRIEGFGTPAEAMYIDNLRAAFPDAATRADAMLSQISTERQIRRPEHRRVGIYFPYRLTFYPEMFNKHRGPGYLDGDVIDVTAHELRLARRSYIMCDIATVKTLDEALALCWEHMARYVIA
ncbi:hypothetical protein [Novosphingobium sp. 9U]|uniref:hypothetical protein n=1 Tax=Novosphingobium sp. 9U TaxID=2653158 RepID=UPI0012EF6916|nr:hypothetical protein [Novosphingobium sp. 9U]VWX51079.1 conserved hypothetical protein [Novosphingobium sp. 9U]